MSNFSSNQTAKIRNLVDEGVGILQQVADLKEGLKDTVKTVAEELGVEPKNLNAAIASAFKGNIADKREAVDEVEILLHAAGRL